MRWRSIDVYKIDHDRKRKLVIVSIVVLIVFQPLEKIPSKGPLETSTLTLYLLN